MYKNKKKKYEVKTRKISEEIDKGGRPVVIVATYNGKILTIQCTTKK